jgi:formate dehydrogenase subunit gamma
MSAKTKRSLPPVQHERTFPRFTVAQRWEHAALMLSGLVLLLTGLPQKYRELEISQDLLSTPERIGLIRQIHHIAAIVLALLAVYHLGRIVYLMAKRRLPGDLLPTWQDVRDAGHMLRYLLFLRSDKPKFGRYNFEQKVTYWVVFFSLLIMGVSGFIIWFPVFFTRFLPGGVVPAAKLAHSTEAVVIAIFVIVWHVYHVHVERTNLSMFTGRVSEEEMHTYHEKEYERLTGQSEPNAKPGAKK